MLNLLINSDIAVVGDFVNNTGFPIACVILLAFYIRELNKQHKEEVKSLSNTIEKMTTAINDLSIQIAKVFVLEEKEK